MGEPMDWRIFTVASANLPAYLKFADYCRNDKPLLAADDSNTPQIIPEDHDQDLEAQRSYQTFRTPSHTSDTASTGSAQRSRINPRIVSDAILGLSDGLTVPFALSAGLSALGNTKVVVLGGLAELAAGASLWGWADTLGQKAKRMSSIFESYQATVRETTELIESSPSETAAIVYDIFASHGVPDDAIAPINSSLHASPDRLREFLIHFYHKESEPDCNQAWTSAITLALCYFVGGFIPLIPYFIVSHVLVALYASVGVMGVTLLVFGYIKTGVVRGWSGRDNIIAGINGGLQMCVVGGVAAGAAIGHLGPSLPQNPKHLLLRIPALELLQLIIQKHQARYILQHLRFRIRIRTRRPRTRLEPFLPHQRRNPLRYIPLISARNAHLANQLGLAFPQVLRANGEAQGV
ncbi:hypothetical protein ARAM_004326 [Aspergillus rambellii]|uniref:Calcium transporter n=1 Tax=Aspergillus rambellii TaxID=308745 RepID=A0A0F8XKF7_9EURO|nr:hypothetical protein ARAM_004326 [Aspergillus rambellii]